MFKRGNGPLVSFLLPTRKRVRWLAEAVDSICSLAVDKRNSFELIFKLDDDDEDTINYINHISALVPVKTIISPRGNGYADMHHWVNEMCSISTGDWLFIFNDDARILTERWDELLQFSQLEGFWHGVDDIFCLVAKVIERPGSAEFIFLRRKVYEILGHWALNPHNDTWIMRVMSSIYSINEIPISIQHFNNEANDITSKETKETCKITLPTITDNKTLMDILKDGLKLAEYIEQHKSADT